MRNPQQQQNPLANIIHFGVQTVDKTSITALPVCKFIQILQAEIHKLQLEQLLSKMSNIGAVMKLIPNKINTTQYKQSYMKFIGIISFIFSKCQDRFNQDNIRQNIRQLITILINKSTNTNMLLNQSYKQKLQEIKKWETIDKQNQFIQPICSYIIQTIDLQYFQQIALLMCYIVKLKLKNKLNEKTVMTFCWILKKYISSQEKINQFVQNIMLLIINLLINSIYINEINMKLYANCLTFLLHSQLTIQQINQLQLHINPLSIASSHFTPKIKLDNEIQSQKNSINLNQQKQEYFAGLCKLYIQTGIQCIMQSIDYFIKTGTTTMMVLNVWNFFNTDNYHILKNTENIMRFGSILKNLESHNKVNNYQCKIKKKDSWISKSIGNKKPYTFVFDCQILNPHQFTDNKEAILFKLEGEKGAILFLIQCYTGTIVQQIKKCQQNKGYQIIIQKYSNSQKSEPIHVGFSSYIFCQFIIELKKDNKLIVYNDKLSKGIQIDHISIGSLKNILIGVKKQKDQQCAIKAITKFYLYDELTYVQYTKLKINQIKTPSKSKKQKQTNLFSILHNGRLHQTKQYNIFQFAIQNQHRGYLKDDEFIKSADENNIQLIRYRNYVETVRMFEGQKNLIAAILCSLKWIKDQNILVQFVKLIHQQFKILKFSKQDFYELFFVSAFCLSMYQHQQVSMLLAEILSSENTNLQYVASNPEKKIDFNEKVYLKLELILDNLLRCGDDKLKLKAMFIVQQLLAVNVEEEQNITLMNETVKKLSFLMMNSINDWTVCSPKIDIHKYKVFSVEQMQIIKKNFDLFSQTVKQAIIKIITICKQPILISQSVINFLNLFIIVLVNSALQKNDYKKQFVFVIFEQIYHILDFLSSLMCSTQKTHNSQKICELLAQMFTILPIMWKFCQKTLFENMNRKQQNYDKQLLNLYEANNRNIQLTTDQSFKLMQKYFRVCIQLGSFSLKSKKNGYETYILEIYQKLSNLKQEPTPLCQISIYEITRSCWKFILNDPPKKYYQLELENKIKLCTKFSSLLTKHPIYFTENEEGQLFFSILKFYISEAEEENFPQNILNKINSTDLENVVKELQKWINEKGNQKEKYQIQLMKILNLYEHSLNYDIIQKQEPKTIEIQWKQIYNWSKIFNDLKNVYEKFRNRELEQQINNAYINMKIYQDQYEQIQMKMKNSPYLFNQQSQPSPNSEGENRRFFRRSTALLAFCNKKNKQKFSNKQKNQNRKNLQKNHDKQKYGNIFGTKNELKEIIQYYCSTYFLEMYTKLSKDKAMVLLAYYKIMDKLSLAERLFNGGVSNQYHQFEYYTLDDYLNNENVKMMLKRDYSSVLNNLIEGEMPRLADEKETNEYEKFAIEIIRNLQNFNKTHHIEQTIIKRNERPQQTKEKSYCLINSYLITKSKIYQGKIEVTDKYINFTENSNIDQNNYQRLYATESQKRTQTQIAIRKKIVNIEIVEVQYSESKKYLHKFEAIEIFSAHLSYFFVFESDQERKLLLKRSDIVSLQPDERKESVFEYQMHWQNGWVSNFHLLANLNNNAGRSFNDLSQYYVFPWIVTNFHGKIDQNFLKNKQNFRDLSKSIGSLNPQKLSMIAKKYQLQTKEYREGQLIPYMFGSFYSNPGVVANFLLRVNPFTAHHYKLQGNKFDLTERLFTDIEDQFFSIYNIQTDNRELVPEFYCAPEFFRNRNQYNFSHQPAQTKINLQMKFPEWVITNSPEQFVFRMRMLLQSEIVTKKIGQWIDLIFGYKSLQLSAVKYNNLYMHELYRETDEKSKKQKQKQGKMVKSTNIKTTQQEVKAHMIKQFGQVPKTLFSKNTSLQPQKSISQNIYNKSIKLISKDIINQDPSFVFDYCQCLLAISNTTTLSFINEIQQVKGINEKIDNEIQSIAILPIKKTHYYLIFTVTILGKLIVYTLKTKAKQYKITNKINLFPSSQFKRVKTMDSFVIIVQYNSLLLLKITQQSSNNILFPITKQSQYYLSNEGYLFFHRWDITNIETYQGLGLVLSIDQESVVNIISLAPDLLIRATFKIGYLKSRELVNKVLMHSMGIILFFTNYQQLLVYNIYGDIIMRVQLDLKGVTDIEFWDNKSSSQILLTTKLNILYKIQLFDMIIKQQDCLTGKKISPSTSQQLTINNKQNNKIVMHRFGLYWKIYIICSATQIYTIQCDAKYNQNYMTKGVLKSCNENASFKNV